VGRWWQSRTLLRWFHFSRQLQSLNLSSKDAGEGRHTLTHCDVELVTVLLREQFEACMEHVESQRMCDMFISGSNLDCPPCTQFRKFRDAGMWMPGDRPKVAKAGA